METSWGSERPSSGCCTWLSAIPSIETGCGKKRSRITLPRRIWQYWWIQITNWPAPTDQRANHVLGCVKSCLASRSRVVILPLCSAPMRSHLDCCVQLWGTQSKKDVKLLECVQKRVKKDDWKDGTPIKRVRDLGLFSLDKRRFWGAFIVTFQYLKCVYKKERERLFSSLFVTGQSKMVLNQRRVSSEYI